MLVSLPFVFCFWYVLFSIDTLFGYWFLFFLGGVLGTLFVDVVV